MREEEARRESLNEQITVRQSEEAQSHSAGLEAWMRARADTKMMYTAEDIAEQYGVVKSSYESVPLPPIRAYQVTFKLLGLIIFCFYASYHTMYAKPSVFYCILGESEGSG